MPINNTLPFLLILFAIHIAHAQVPMPIYGKAEPVKLADDSAYLSLWSIPVTEVGSKHPEPIYKIPVTAYVFVTDSLAQFGTTDLPEILQHTPGVEFSDPGYFIEGGQRTVAGNWSKSVLLINGIPMNFTYTGRALMNRNIPLIGTDQIEVIQGPNSVMYGANAFSGLINIKSATPKREGISAQLNQSAHISTGQQAISSTTSTCLLVKKGNLELNLSGSYNQEQLSNLADYQIPDLLSSAKTHSTGTNTGKSIFFNARYSLIRNTISLTGLHQESEIKQETNQPTHTAQKLASTGLSVLGIEAVHTIDLMHSVAVRMHIHSDDVENLPHNFSSAQKETGNTVTISPSKAGNAEANWRIKNDILKNYTTLGAGGTTSLLGKARGTDISADSLEQFRESKSVFLFVQFQQYLFSNKLYATLGLRRDFNELYPASLSMRHGLNFIVRSNLLIRYTFSEGYSAPTPADLALNPKILPEHNQSQEVCVNWAIRPQLKLQSALYFSSLYDIIEPLPEGHTTTKGRTYFADNSGRYNSIGNETVLHFSLARLHGMLWANYSHLGNETNITNLSYTDPLTNLNRIKSGFRISRPFARFHSVSVLFRYASSSVADVYLPQGSISTISVPQQVQLDAVYRFADIPIGTMLAHFDLSVKNITDHENFHPNFTSSSPALYHADGRSLWITAGFTL